MHTDHMVYAYILFKKIIIYLSIVLKKKIHDYYELPVSVGTLNDKQYISMNMGHN